MSRPSAVLFLPPGWTLVPGGPHLALPLLKGFLEKRGVPTEIVDLNLAAASHYGAGISDRAVRNACTPASLDSMNAPYFKAEDRLTSVAALHSGTWELHDGFRFATQDAESSESVREHSTLRSPFTDCYAAHAIPLVMARNPTLVGVSITVTTQLIPAFELCRRLRQAGYQERIVLGGNIITRIKDELRLDWIFDLIDGFVSLQGEESVFALACGMSMETVPNLTWRRGATIISNPDKTLPREQFDVPQFEGLPLASYWGERYLPMIASRGCYYGKCKFCAIPYGWGNGGFIGNGAAEDVVANMKAAYETHGISNFKFVDEALNPPLLRHIAELLLRESLPIAFEGYARFDPAWEDSSYLDLVSRAGLRKVYLGLELVASGTRTLLNKGDRVAERAAEVLERLHDTSILTHCFCMFGFPGTGRAEALDTMEFAFRHATLIDSLDIFPFYYAKHTQVDGIKAIAPEGKDWAVEYEYEPDSASVLSSGEVKNLCDQLEAFVWRERPTWLHPVYRMFSPWGVVPEPAVAKSKPRQAGLWRMPSTIPNSPALSVGALG